MEKLGLTCTCGQHMKVPKSALGQEGLCPNCGARIQITEENTSTRAVAPLRRGGGLLSLRRQKVVRQENAHREESWRNFAAAVDLYNNRRYAEALTLLNSLLKNFPGNEHIETARNQCLEALQRTATSGRRYDGQPIDEAVLSPELIKSVVLEKLLNGATEEVQLQAADLASRLLGVHEGESEYADDYDEAYASPEIPLQVQQRRPQTEEPQDARPANGAAHAEETGETTAEPASAAPLAQAEPEKPVDTAPHIILSPREAANNGAAPTLMLPEAWRIHRESEGARFARRWVVGAAETEEE